jgi:hypothetical protein
MNTKVTKESNTKNVKKTKFEHIYQDEDSTSIWKYDLNKQPNGPISVEIKYSAAYLKNMELKKRRGR